MFYVFFPAVTHFFILVYKNILNIMTVFFLNLWINKYTYKGKDEYKDCFLGGRVRSGDTLLCRTKGGKIKQRKDTLENNN